MNTFLLGLVLSPACLAGPADYVYTPNIERGELELDVKYGAASANFGRHPQAVSVGLGYGVTEHWFTEGYLKQNRTAIGNSSYIEWENRFLLMGGDSGKNLVDVGFVTELEAPLTRGAPWELRIGPLFQSKVGKFQFNGNVIFERVVGGADADSVAQATNIGYQWQTRYKTGAAFDLGLQGFGELGKWDQWSKAAEQNHRIGPAIFGKLALGAQEAIKYNAACLVGLSAAAPHTTLRIQLEQEF